MRRSESRVWRLFAVLVPLAGIGVSVAISPTGCVVPLDDEFSDAEPDASEERPDSEAGATPDPGCRPFEALSSATTLTGDLRSIAQSDGSSLWIVDEARVADAGGAPGAFAVGPGAGVSCADWNAKFEGHAFAPSPLAPSGFAAPLDLVAMPSGLGLYYALFVADPTATFGIREVGIGLAPRDAVSGLFVPTSELLWSPDRPNFGTSALLVGATVYAFGCASTGAFSANCFVARADVANLASTAAYSYWTGEGWSSEIDDAAPITQAGGTVSVRPDPTGGARYIMTFVPPLGNTLVAQSAPSPEGPWSASVTLATCALDAGAGAFCGGGEQHPELAGAPGQLVLSYAAQTFASDAGVSRDAFWPHIVSIDVPKSLP
jgi:hypothetical protein